MFFNPKQCLGKPNMPRAMSETAVITTHPEGRLSDKRGAKEEIAVPVETLSSSPRWSLSNNDGSIKQSK